MSITMPINSPLIEKFLCIIGAWYPGQLLEVVACKKHVTKINCFLLAKSGICLYDGMQKMAISQTPDLLLILNDS
ncbi:MAG: hypothetical protein JJU30_03925 [Alkalimonas sp.]|nr:hypothetical protein [Alkalimonas sp.]